MEWSLFLPLCYLSVTLSRFYPMSRFYLMYVRLNIQGISDTNRRFMFISGGFPASVSNATLFGKI